MTEASIFQGVLRGEDSHTRLLYNLLKRDNNFRKRVLSLFADGVSTQTLESATIHNQEGLKKKCGRPDLLIEGPGLSIIVEVKTENHCEMTIKQSVAGDDPERYLAYLESRRAKGAQCALVFLTPPDWKHRADVEQDIIEYTRKGLEKGVDVKLITWEQLTVNQNYSESFGSGLTQEFITLLRERYQPFNFTESELTSMKTSEMSIETLLGIGKFVYDVRQKAKRSAAELELASDEIGFFLKESNKWVLFVGFWLPVWKEHGHALCFGVEDNSLKPAFDQALKKVYNQEAIDFRNYHLGFVPHDDLKVNEPAQATWAKLNELWVSLESAPE